ncbi:MAG: ATP-binding cassette domain-containing protein [Desulfobacterales bacterium]|nr:ATP-binding cassette domain-containing protein [Desulfobacterales bacterium]
MAETLIKVENVSKKFCRNLKRSLWYGMKDLGSELLGRSVCNDKDLRRDEFWAVENVSFELKRGECLGLIGRNGAGKTTLLRMLNGLIKPDRGRIEMHGRVGALIALGAGFNPILTGRENIYVNASVLGLSTKEIDKIFDKIVEFADLGEFIDMPVQSYSSGMTVRLGFSIASRLNPDILLIDEVLSVGDRPFRVKCYNLVAELREKTSMILVSHNMGEILRVCTSVMLLHQNKMLFFGDTQEGIDFYNSFSDLKEQSFSVTSEGFIFRNIQIDPQKLTGDPKMKISVVFESPTKIHDCIIRFPILDELGTVIAEWRSSNHNLFYTIQRGHNTINVEINNLNLRNGSYFLTFVLSPIDGLRYLINVHQVIAFKVAMGQIGLSACQF